MRKYLIHDSVTMPGLLVPTGKYVKIHLRKILKDIDNIIPVRASESRQTKMFFQLLGISSNPRISSKPSIKRRNLKHPSAEVISKIKASLLSKTNHP